MEPMRGVCWTEGLRHDGAQLVGSVVVEKEQQLLGDAPDRTRPA